MRAQLPIELAKIRTTAEEARDTAAWEYQLQAIKALREAMGVPKTQIIESAHDLSDRLRKFFSKEQEWQWTWNYGYYRCSFAHLLARPLVWIEILRRSTTYLDRSLGDAIAGEFEFQRCSRSLEYAFTDVDLFKGTDYDRGRASAHLFAGSMSEMTSQMIKQEGSMLLCMEYGEFSKLCGNATDGQKPYPTPALDRLISDLGRDSSGDFYRLARLLYIYCCACGLLEQFHLPYRQFEGLDDALERRRDILQGELGEKLSSNLERLVRGSMETQSKDGRVDENGSSDASS